MRYAILGTAQATRDDGTPVAVGGARLRALLTALALRPGRTVPTDLLVDQVWDGDPPGDAVAALQALVARLRRALGHGAVRSAEGGYLLAADRDDIDLYRFERLAGSAAAEPDPARAAALYDEALALWRGPALACLPDPAAESARWEAVRMDARRGRMAAALALGQAERVLPELGALCAEQPLDEPWQALRIRALRDAGRTAEALAAYEQVRRGLADRLGADPGPALRALHAELLAPGPTPVPGPAPVPASAATVPVSAPVPAPAPSVPSAVPGNLRSRLTTFVGREEDIRVIGDDLARARLVTLLGPGGAGKTRLSQEAAEAQAPDGLPDGVWLVELAPVDDPEDVPEAVLAALGARETKLRGAAAEELRALTDRTGDDPLERLVEHCARRRLLLLLDNCEHVVKAAAALAEELLARCPGVRILATSREPLGVPGETLRPVEPLPDPVALRLLADRGAAARPGFRVEDDPAAAAEICRRLDGLPLAIELAAARLRLLTARQIADRLDDRFRLLTSGSRTVLPRQQTLRAVVDWSWDLLDAPERAVLRRLSVFAGGCDLAAAEAVCGEAVDVAALDIAAVDPAAAGTGPGPGAPAPAGSQAAAWDTSAVQDASAVRDGADVLSLLGSLVDKSLVVAAPGPDGDMRYRLLETVAEYAAERLHETPGDRDATERRHLTHYRELARTTEPLLRGQGQREAGERLAVEYENIRTALRRAVATKDVGEVLCLVHSLGWYWHMHDLRAESRHWSALAAALGPDPFARPLVPAEPVLERIVDSPPPYTGELLTEAWRGVQMLCMVSRDQTSTDWNSPEMREQVEAIVQVYRPGLPQTCQFPGAFWIFAVMINGDVALLRRILDATVDASRELGYRWAYASALQLRANILANHADWSGDAARDAEESLAVFRELGDAWGCAEALSARAESLEKRGEFDLAAADYRAAVDYAERLGAQAQVTVLRVRRAGALIENDQVEEAEAILDELMGVVQQLNNEAMPAARMFLAGVYGRTGRIPRARAELLSLREEFATGAYAIFDCFLLAMLAWLDNQEGKHREARALNRQAMAAAQDPLASMVAPQMPAIFMITAAVCLAGLGGRERAYDAARLIGAYRAMLPPGHFPVSIERADAARAEEGARAVLGDAAFEAACAEGGGLSLEEATALC